MSLGISFVSHWANGCGVLTLLSGGVVSESNWAIVG